VSDLGIALRPYLPGAPPAVAREELALVRFHVTLVHKVARGVVPSQKHPRGYFHRPGNNRAAVQKRNRAVPDVAAEVQRVLRKRRRVVPADVPLRL
jgi:hypothetical protein